MKIGVVSDTHGLLRPEVEAVLDGCAVILHGGDIGGQDILDALGELAPVYPVRGNNDWGPWGESIPLTRELELGGLRICMAHMKRDLPGDLTSYDLVITGHTHKYAESRQGKTLLLNPGSCSGCVRKPSSSESKPRASASSAIAAPSFSRPLFQFVERANFTSAAYRMPGGSISLKMLLSAFTEPS